MGQWIRRLKPWMISLSALTVALLMILYKGTALRSTMFSSIRDYILEYTTKSLPEEKVVVKRQFQKSDADFIFMEPANITPENLLYNTNLKNKQKFIPKIIHQMWDTYSIPNVHIPWIQKTLAKHPDWEYWFWNQTELQCYLKKNYPQYLQVYNRYPSTIFRMDFMRYFILYDIGGLYYDLDVEPLKAMDPWRYISPCIVSYETYEHFFVNYKHKREFPNLLNAVLMTVPKHKYFKTIIEHLEEYQNKYYNDVLKSTGPFFIDAMLQKYIRANSINSWTVSTNEDKNQHFDNKFLTINITIIDPKYWLSTYDPWMARQLKKECSLMDFEGSDEEEVITNKRFNQLKHDICNKNIENHYINSPYKDAYLDHHWVHSYLKNKKTFFYLNVTKLNEIIPRFKTVSERLGLRC